MKKNIKIVVIGGTGLIGSRLVNNLRERGQQAVAASPSLAVNTITGWVRGFLKGRSAAVRGDMDIRIGTCGRHCPRDCGVAAATSDGSHGLQSMDSPPMRLVRRVSDAPYGQLARPGVSMLRRYRDAGNSDACGPADWKSTATTVHRYAVEASA